MAEPRELVVTIRAREQASQAFERIQQSLSGINASLKVVSGAAHDTTQATERMSQGFTRTEARVVTLAATLNLIGQAARGLRQAFDQTFGGFVRDAVALQDLAHRMDLPVEELSKLQLVAQRTELDVADLAPALRKVAVAIAEAQDPASKFGKFFAEGLRLSREEIKRLQTALPTEQLVALVQAFDRVGEGAFKSRAEFETFGQRSVAAVRQLSGSVGDLGQALKEAATSPALITPDMAAKANALDDAIDLLKESWKGLRNEFALAGPLVEAQRIIEQLTAALASPAARDSVAALSKEIGDLFRIVAQAVPGIIQS